MSHRLKEHDPNVRFANWKINVHVVCAHMRVPRIILLFFTL